MAKFSYRSKAAIAVLTNKPHWGLLTNSTNAVKITEMELMIGSATSSEFALGIASSAGTQTSGVSPVNLVLGGAAGTSKIATAWSVDPGIPALFIKGAYFPATIGSVIYWSWPDGLYVPVDSELVLWNTSAGTNAANVMVNVVLEEL